MGLFERYLSVWVGLCILVGVALGNVVPQVFEALARVEVAQVNLVVAVLIWIMIYPMMVQVDFGSIRSIGARPKGIDHHSDRQLVDQAFHNGSAGLGLLQVSVR